MCALVKAPGLEGIQTRLYDISGYTCGVRSTSVVSLPPDRVYSILSSGRWDSIFRNVTKKSQQTFNYEGRVEEEVTIELQIMKYRRDFRLNLMIDFCKQQRTVKASMPKPGMMMRRYESVWQVLPYVPEEGEPSVPGSPSRVLLDQRFALPRLAMPPPPLSRMVKGTIQSTVGQSMEDLVKAAEGEHSTDDRDLGSGGATSYLPAAPVTPSRPDPEARPMFKQNIVPKPDGMPRRTAVVNASALAAHQAPMSAEALEQQRRDVAASLYGPTRKRKAEELRSHPLDLTSSMEITSTIMDDSAGEEEGPVSATKGSTKASINPAMVPALDALDELIAACDRMHDTLTATLGDTDSDAEEYFEAQENLSTSSASDADSVQE